MQHNFDDYPVGQKVETEDGNCLVRFISFYSEEKKIPEIFGKEVFLFDKEGNVIWQIDVPRGFGKTYDRENFKIIEKEYDSYFCAIYKKEGKYLAERFDSYVFELDMETGKGNYIYWTK